MSDIWNAQQYSKFSDERMRPAIDLLARVDYAQPKLIYDLGCGTGTVTALLQQRWPEAEIIGVDNSAVMLDKAKQLFPQYNWIQADLATWQPDKKADIVFTNAALQWLDNHPKLLPNLLQLLNPNGILAIQMPNNYQSPSHLNIIETVENGPWRDRLLKVLRYKKSQSGENIGPVASMSDYYEILSPLVKHLDIWETEYLQVLEGENPVLEWMMGTGLRPVIKELNEVEQKIFINDYAAKLGKAYPKNKDNKTLFLFKRVFIVIRK